MAKKHEQMILDLLEINEFGELWLHAQLDCSARVLRQSLAKLKKLGLIDQCKEDGETYYALVPGNARKLIDAGYEWNPDPEKAACYLDTVARLFDDPLMKVAARYVRAYRSDKD